MTLSPVLPSLSAGKGLGKTGFVTLMKPSPLQPPSGQIRCFLTLSAGSLPVFADPNASPSATSVCPLLYPPPPLPPLPPPSLHQIR
ncbi:hypothetical protein F7725_008438 [Dissostichus mawsoni]|uniref:Uncharacterized protein n=1 Tax=Dissostichus mawsoni TaxID=36200 RepID=A0A7J5Y773_DISMA|nr:hypothetical protein F7725_008438 [Dissostichus mawsoni]